MAVVRLVVRTTLERNMPHLLSSSAAAVRCVAVFPTLVASTSPHKAGEDAITDSSNMLISVSSAGMSALC